MVDWRTITVGKYGNQQGMDTSELSHREVGREPGYFCTSPVGHWVRVLPSLGGQHNWPLESLGRVGSGGQRKPQMDRVRDGSWKLGQQVMNR